VLTLLQLYLTPLLIREIPLSFTIREGGGIAGAFGRLTTLPAVRAVPPQQGSLAKAKGALLGPSPDGYQGWGRVNMAGSLPLVGFTDPRVKLQLLDRGQFTNPGQSVSVDGIYATGRG
jgi:hypothetical protein